MPIEEEKIEKIYGAMSEIENYMYKTILFYTDYCVVEKSQMRNKLQVLYNALPVELVNNKEHLLECKEDNVFTKLNKINMIIEQSKSILGIIIINSKTIMDIFDDIYASLPEEIEMCK